MPPKKQLNSKELFSVFVGRLNIDVTEKDLLDLFSGCGTVADHCIMPPKDDKFKYGFVRYKTREEAVRAIKDLNGWKLKSSCILVDIAKECSIKLQADSFRPLEMPSMKVLVEDDSFQLDEYPGCVDSIINMNRVKETCLWVNSELAASSCTGLVKTASIMEDLDTKGGASSLFAPVCKPSGRCFESAKKLAEKIDQCECQSEDPRWSALAESFLNEYSAISQAVTAMIKGAKSKKPVSEKRKKNLELKSSKEVDLSVPSITEEVDEHCYKVKGNRKDGGMAADLTTDDTTSSTKCPGLSQDCRRFSICNSDGEQPHSARNSVKNTGLTSKCYAEVSGMLVTGGHSSDGGSSRTQSFASSKDKINVQMNNKNGSMQNNSRASLRTDTPLSGEPAIYFDEFSALDSLKTSLIHSCKSAPVLSPRSNVISMAGRGRSILSHHSQGALPRSSVCQAMSSNLLVSAPDAKQISLTGRSTESCPTSPLTSSISTSVSLPSSEVCSKRFLNSHADKSHGAVNSENCSYETQHQNGQLKPVHTGLKSCKVKRDKNGNDISFCYDKNLSKFQEPHRDLKEHETNCEIEDGLLELGRKFRQKYLTESVEIEVSRPAVAGDHHIDAEGIATTAEEINKSELPLENAAKTWKDKENEDDAEQEWELQKSLQSNKYEKLASDLFQQLLSSDTLPNDSNSPNRALTSKSNSVLASPSVDSRVNCESSIPSSLVSKVDQNWSASGGDAAFVKEKNTVCTNSLSELVQKTVPLSINDSTNMCEKTATRVPSAIMDSNSINLQTDHFVDGSTCVQEEGRETESCSKKLSPVYARKTEIAPPVQLVLETGRQTTSGASRIRLSQLALLVQKSASPSSCEVVRFPYVRNKQSSPQSDGSISPYSSSSSSWC